MMESTSLEGAVATRAPLVIRTLGRCELVVRGEVAPHEACGDRRTLRLLWALVTLGGQRVARKDLIDFVWPDESEDQSLRLFYDAVHRLHTGIGRTVDPELGVIRVEGPHVSLDRSLCVADCWAFEEAVGRARRFEVYGQMEDTRNALRDAHVLYRGPYLPAVTNLVWVDAKRHTLHQQWLWVDRKRAGGE